MDRTVSDPLPIIHKCFLSKCRGVGVKRGLLMWKVRNREDGEGTKREVSEGTLLLRHLAFHSDAP